MHRPSLQSGRISFVALAGVLCVGMVALLFAFSGQTPRSAASEFMSALAKGDVDKLAENSIIQNKPKEEVKKEWHETMKNARNYFFLWEITAVTQSGDTATVRLNRTEHPDNPDSYAEHFELEMVKTKDGWKVDVPQIARTMFPFLPQ
jgi:hypothetical protein